MTSPEVWAKPSNSRNRKRDFKIKILNQNEAKKGLCFKLLYSIGCVGYFSGCLYQSWQFLDIYFKYPTTMEVNVVQEPIVTFPAVTVCNGNRYLLLINMIFERVEINLS